jgi:hypothetical protein
MSGNISTSAGTQPVDPYKAKSAEDPPLIKKVEDLTALISEVRMGMLTTKASDSELLVSRCMALAAQVSTPYMYLDRQGQIIMIHNNPTRKTAAST